MFRGHRGLAREKEKATDVRGTFGRLMAYFKPYWLMLLAAGVLLLINTSMQVLEPYLREVALDQFIVPGSTGEPGPGTRPLDMDLSDDGRFLFTLNIGDGTISTFAVLHDGSLDHLHVVDGVPGGVNGLAAR